MIDDVRDSYDGLVELYTQVNLDAMERNPRDADAMAEFARHTAQQPGIAADLGCGPGHVTDHLRQLGCRVVGYDISPAMIDQARTLFPDTDYRVGNFNEVGFDEDLAGILSRYSSIHAPPSELAATFGHWFDLLADGAPLLVQFFGARSVETHGEAFDHKVTTAHAFFPATVIETLEAAGFGIVEWSALPMPDSIRPYDHTTVLARKMPSQ